MRHPIQTNFYPRPPRGGRPDRPSWRGYRPQFLSTPSARRATKRILLLETICLISIHALREEGDQANSFTRNHLPNFYPRPPRGGRLLARLSCPFGSSISIHALREEGDYDCRFLCTIFVPFLSTPSARRATLDEIVERKSTLRISIHALREEGDRKRGSAAEEYSGFLSTPSARRATQAYNALKNNPFVFLSTPSARRATIYYQAYQRLYTFLSTPSARRATAKTERKHPAFVSLYTSLHKLQRDACKTNRKITPLLAQTAGIPVRSVPENHVCCRFALAGHQKISTLSWANSGCSPTCSTLVW